MDCPAWGTSLREYVRRCPDSDERREAAPSTASSA